MPFCTSINLPTIQCCHSHLCQLQVCAAVLAHWHSATSLLTLAGEIPMQNWYTLHTAPLLLAGLASLWWSTIHLTKLKIPACHCTVQRFRRVARIFWRGVPTAIYCINKSRHSPPAGCWDILNILLNPSSEIWVCKGYSSYINCIGLESWYK